MPDRIAELLVRSAGYRPITDSTSRDNAPVMLGFGLAPIGEAVRVMARSPLAIYLQDHHAGAMAGVNLVRRCARTTAQTPGGAVVAEVAVEVESDRRTLERAMTALSVPASAPKSAGAWLAEKLGRLKPNGRARAGGSMQALHELEMLSLGLTGKRALWTALQAVPGLADRANLDLVGLAARAQDQFDRIEAVRLNEVRAAFQSIDSRDL